MLKTLLRQEIERRGIGVRAAAKEIGVSHSTIYEVYHDRPLRVDTAYLICQWLGVPLTTAVNSVDDTDATTAAIRLLLRSAPDLEKVFASAVQELNNGNLTPEDFQDVIEFAAYKIQRKQKHITSEVKDDQPNEETVIGRTDPDRRASTGE